MATTVLKSAAEATYDEGYELFYKFDPQCESSRQLEQEEKYVFDLLYEFEWVEINNDGVSEGVTDTYEKMRHLIKEVFNAVDSDHDDHPDDQIYDFLSNIDFSGLPYVVRETFDRSQLDSALGRSWIMDDSIKVLRRVCQEIQDHDVFVEFLINHTTEVRRVYKEISQNNIPGGCDDWYCRTSYFRTNEYETMLCAAVRRHVDTLRADRELAGDDQWTDYKLAVLFFIVLEEIDVLLLDPNTELEILLELIYAEIDQDY